MKASALIMRMNFGLPSMTIVPAELPTHNDGAKGVGSAELYCRRAMDVELFRNASPIKVFLAFR